jgi:hypothetical protein
MPTIDALPNTLGDAVVRCQQIMGDPTGRWCSRSYAVPFINQAYSSIAKKLKNASGKNFEAIVEVLNVPTGTTDLSIYSSYGDPTVAPPIARGPTVGLYDPLRLWVKTAGQLPQYYTRAKGPRDTLPHVNPPGISPGTYAVQVTFAWIGNKLSITPVAGPIDIQVYGRFNAARLQQDTDVLVLHGDMTDTLAFAACSLMGVERTNPAILEGYSQEAIAGIDNIVADIIRQSQREPRRLAKLGGGGGTHWGWN